MSGIEGRCKHRELAFNHHNIRAHVFNGSLQSPTSRVHHKCYLIACMCISREAISYPGNPELALTMGVDKATFFCTFVISVSTLILPSFTLVSFCRTSVAIAYVSRCMWIVRCCFQMRKHVLLYVNTASSSTLGESYLVSDRMRT